MTFQPSVARTIALPDASIGTCARLVWPAKDPATYQDYSLDVSAWLTDAGSTLGSTFAAQPSPATALTVNTLSIAGNVLTMWIDGGRAGNTYSVGIDLTDSAGRALHVTVWLPVQSETASDTLSPSVIVGPTGPPGSLGPVSIYTASGSINPGDGVSVINTTATATMTLANGITDGLPIIIKRFGAGAVAILSTIDGTPGSSLALNSSGGGDSVILVWSVALTSWLLVTTGGSAPVTSSVQAQVTVNGSLLTDGSGHVLIFGTSS